MSEKMREEFEAWAVTSAWLGIGDESQMHQDADGTGYNEIEVHTAWLAWKASRESLPAAYNAVDMATAAADGFRDGAASKSEPCDGCFMAEAEALRKDAALGRVAIKYIDRLCDPAETDSLETIVEEYVAAFSAAMSKES